MTRRPPGGGAAAALATAVLGTLVWLAALLGGAVSSPTVWTVVGVGVGALLVSSAVRHSGRRGLTLPDLREALAWRGYRTAGVLLAVVLSGALVALLASGPGAAALVLGGPGGVVLWVTSTALVAAAGPTAVSSRSRPR